MGETVLGAASEDVAAPVAEDFFEGTKYSSKVLGQMGKEDLHGFPESVKAFQDAGQVSRITGGDGIGRDLLKIPGGYKGREGNFEFIKEADGLIKRLIPLAPVTPMPCFKAG